MENSVTVMPNPMLSDRFVRAIEFASVVHATQVRKGTCIPYLAHLLAVASLVIEHGGDEDTTIAALLHDAPEDRGGRTMLAQVCLRFGEAVAKIVEGCSDTFDEPKPHYAERKTAYVEHLARDASLETCLVSAADKLHNARAILHDLRAATAPLNFWTRFSDSPLGIGWYFGRVEHALNTRLAGHDGRELVAELSHTLNSIATLPGCDAFYTGLESGRAGEPLPNRAGPERDRP
jgi:hypothetical protein